MHEVLILYDLRGCFESFVLESCRTEPSALNFNGVQTLASAQKCGQKCHKNDEAKGRIGFKNTERALGALNVPAPDLPH
jgi:hypothetical protein